MNSRSATGSCKGLVHTAPWTRLCQSGQRATAKALAGLGRHVEECPVAEKALGMWKPASALQEMLRVHKFPKQLLTNSKLMEPSSSMFRAL